MASAVVVSGLTVTTSEPFCWSNTLTCMGNLLVLWESPQ
jgi:hypothetical protein